MVAIGKIISTQGNRGEVRVLPLTDFPQRFKALSGVYLWDEKARRDGVQIENVRYHKKFVILKFKDCDSLSQAQKFKGLLVAVKKADRVKLPPDQYYIGDLIGMDVFSDEGGYLGKIQDALRMPGNDVYVVKDHEELLIPAIKQVVKQVDMAKRRMTVHLMKGLEI